MEDREQRECPLCGSTMRIKETQTVTYIPGNPTPVTRPHREWVCPDCDNFEEAEE
jgi:ssDNA-binding Zn-finger/Zn-ribbon topoisomerase 1